MNRNWYAVYTKPQTEKKVAALLTKKKIENLYPLNRITNGHGNRRKMQYEPLFPTFVFVNITEAEMHEVRKTNDVINFVYWLGKPAVIKTAEIENIAHFAGLYYNIKLEKTAVNSSGMLRISNEPVLAGLKTTLLPVKTTKIKLTLPSLGFVLIAETEKASLETFRFGMENSTILM